MSCHLRIFLLFYILYIIYVFCLIFQDISFHFICITRDLKRSKSDDPGHTHSILLQCRACKLKKFHTPITRSSGGRNAVDNDNAIRRILPRKLNCVSICIGETTKFEHSVLLNTVRRVRAIILLPLRSNFDRL